LTKGDFGYWISKGPKLMQQNHTKQIHDPDLIYILLDSIEVDVTIKLRDITTFTSPAIAHANWPRTPAMVYRIGRERGGSAGRDMVATLIVMSY